MSRASSHYISRATPNPEPLVFSETTHANVRRIHTFSGQAVQISSKTVGLIHDTVDKFTHKLGGSSSKSPISPTDTRGAQASARKPRLRNRLLMSTDMLLTAVEQSASTLIQSGTQSVSRGVGHKSERTLYCLQIAAKLTVIKPKVRQRSRRSSGTNWKDCPQCFGGLCGC